MLERLSDLDVRSLLERQRDVGLRTWIRRSFALLGVVTIVTAVLLAAFQVVLPTPLREPLGNVAESVGKDPITWLLATAGTTYGVWLVFRGRKSSAVSPELADDPPEEANVDVTRTGHRFERVVESQATTVEDPEVDGEEIRDALRDVAIDVMTRSGEWTRESAAAAIESGEWTDDRIAATFLGGPEAPGYPLDARIRGWLRPQLAFQQRTERATAAIHEHLADQEDVVANVDTADRVEVIA